MVFGPMTSGVHNKLNLCGGSEHPGHLLFAPHFYTNNYFISGFSAGNKNYV